MMNMTSPLPVSLPLKSLVFSVLIAILLLGGRDTVIAWDSGGGRGETVTVFVAALVQGAGGAIQVPMDRDWIVFPNWWSYDEFLTNWVRKGSLFPQAYSIGTLIVSLVCAGVLLWVIRARASLASQVAVALLPSFLGGLLTLFQFSNWRYVLLRDGRVGPADPTLIAILSMGSTIWGVLSSLFFLVVLFSFYVFRKRRGKFSRRDEQPESLRSMTEV